jgi:xanthine dehydrogenase accessory factor
MAINDRGEISGSVSGGCVEGAVVEIAERVIGSGHPDLAHFGIADAEAWGVGLPCGGEIDVWVQAYEPGPFEVAARSGARAAQVTLLAGPQAGAKLVITPDLANLAVGLQQPVHRSLRASALGGAGLGFGGLGRGGWRRR